MFEAWSSGHKRVFLVTLGVVVGRVGQGQAITGHHRYQHGETFLAHYEDSSTLFLCFLPTSLSLSFLPFLFYLFVLIGWSVARLVDRLVVRSFEHTFILVLIHSVDPFFNSFFFFRSFLFVPLLVNPALLRIHANIIVETIFFVCACVCMCARLCVCACVFVFE